MKSLVSTKASLQIVRDETSRLMRNIAPTQLEAVAELCLAISKGGKTGMRWFFSGQGRSGLVAQMVAMRFMHLGLNSHFVGEASAPSIQPEDVLMLISGSGSTHVTLHFGKIAHDVGAKVISITRAGDSALQKLSDITLEIPASDSRQFAGSLFEQDALLACDALFVRLVKEFGEFEAEMARRYTNFQ
ncbi:MAG: SIS domain-containing protein [Acetobacteraceae bacterium]